MGLVAAADVNTDLRANSQGTDVFATDVLLLLQCLCQAKRPKVMLVVFYIIKWLTSVLSRAGTGCLSDADPICHGLNKYGSLQLHIKASFWAQVAKNYKINVPLPVMKLPINRF